MKGVCFTETGGKPTAEGSISMSQTFRRIRTNRGWIPEKSYAAIASFPSEG